MYASMMILLLVAAATVWGHEFLALPLGARLTVGFGVLVTVFSLAWWEYEYRRRRR